MPFDFFKVLVGTLCSKDGKVRRIRFWQSDGKYHAVSGDMRFTGNSIAHRISIKCGNHEFLYPQEV